MRACSAPHGSEGRQRNKSGDRDLQTQCGCEKPRQWRRVEMHGRLSQMRFSERGPFRPRCSADALRRQLGDLGRGDRPGGRNQGCIACRDGMRRPPARGRKRLQAGAGARQSPGSVPSRAGSHSAHPLASVRRVAQRLARTLPAVLLWQSWARPVRSAWYWKIGARHRRVVARDGAGVQKHAEQCQNADPLARAHRKPDLKPPASKTQPRIGLNRDYRRFSHPP